MSTFEKNNLSSDSSSEKTEKAELLYREEIANYTKLLDHLRQIDGLNITSSSTRGSLAFLVEAIKRNQGEDWPMKIFSLIQEIEKIQEISGAIGVSGFLSEKINQHYLHSLAMRNLKTTDESLKRKLDILQKMTQQMVDFNRQMQAAGRAVTPGGVSHDYFPTWFHSVDQNL